MSDRASGLQGRIEFFDHRVIKGWALDRDAPGLVARLCVFVGDDLLAEVVPTTFRWDLKTQGLGTGCHGFVLPLTEGLSRDRGAVLRFRLASSGEELEGSPVRIEPRGEQLLAPFTATDLRGNRALVLAPHPDDESLACGGSLALHRIHEDPVKVVFLTDGARGDARKTHETGAYVALRQREAREACGLLGVSDIEFWGFPDRGLSDAAAAPGRLRTLLQSYAPTLIYAPSPLEFHPDHLDAARLLFRALQGPVADTQVALYELNRPINVNALVNITTVIDRKRRACHAYRSQLENLPYAEVAEGLSRYRALTISSQAKYAEGFFVMPAADVVGQTVDSFSVRQFRSPGRRDGGDAPLVSIVVRTRDRRALLREALSSIVTQSYSNLEVVVVNDGGEDVSDELKEFQELLPLRSVRHETPRGRAAAANAGVGCATGRYLLFLDDDDLLYPRHVEKLARYLEASGERMAYSDCERVHHRWTGDCFEQVGEARLFQGVDFDRDRLYHSNFIPFMTAMVRRDLAEETGPFDENLEYLEDWDFWIRASQRDVFQHLPGVTARYRVFGAHTYVSSQLDLIRKHRSYWTPERLKATIWPRVTALTEESQKKGQRIDELEQQVAALEKRRQEDASHVDDQEGKVSRLEGRLAAAAARSEQLRGELERREGELGGAQAELEAIRGAHEKALHELGLVTGSYSWRLTRLLPQPVRARLRELLDAWKERPVPPRAPGPTDAASGTRPGSGEGNGFLIRGYEPGDEDQILELFAACFGHRRSGDHWRWKYVDNPQGSTAISLAFDSQGQLLAHYGAYPCRLIDVTAGTPRSISAYQVGDTMTRTSARAVGRRSTSLLFRVTQDFFRRYCEGQTGLNYGFNEGKIRRYYLRLIEGSRFLEPAPHRVLTLRAPPPPTSGSLYRVERVDETDGQFDEFFERVTPDYRLLVVRDRVYVQWRYLDAPDVDYEVYAAHSRDHLVGWGVFRRQGERLVWGDALFDRGHPEAVSTLLARALAAPQNLGVTQVDGWFPSNPPWWNDLLQAQGFESRPDPQDLGLIYLPFEEPDPTERFRAALYYAKGDGDLF